jgi:methylmalonyl-CoA mutase
VQDLKGKPIEALVWRSPEGIPVKPIYTKEDTKSLDVAQLAGVHPYTRGVRASMYTVRPWTIRQVRVNVEDEVLGSWCSP